jgi:hypothetical protein
MNHAVQISEVVGATDDEFLKTALLAAAHYGCVFHEETCAPPRRSITDGVAVAETEYRYTIILPDGRLVTCLPWHPRKQALLRVCRAAVPYLRQISEWEKFAKFSSVDKLTV